jgi:hypothetical protein
MDDFFYKISNIFCILTVQSCRACSTAPLVWVSFSSQPSRVLPSRAWTCAVCASPLTSAENFSLSVTAISFSSASCKLMRLDELISRDTSSSWDGEAGPSAPNSSSKMSHRCSRICKYRYYELTHIIILSVYLPGGAQCRAKCPLRFEFFAAFRSLSGAHL